MKIICIGHNYKEHIKELGHQIPEKPVFFMKPETALLTHNRPFFLPEFSNMIHYETEIVVKINKLGKYISRKYAPTYYDEISLGIDFTARDLQQTAIAKGLPWEYCKSFDNSAALGKWIPKTQLENLQNIPFKLLINDKEVQHGNTSDMIFSIDEIIEYVSKFVTLKIGDLIYTGTPFGVGQVCLNDKLTGYIDQTEMFKFN